MRESRIILVAVAAGLLALRAIGAVEGDVPSARDQHWRTGSAAFTDGLQSVAETELKAYLRLAAKDPGEATRAADAVSMLARLFLEQKREGELLQFLSENKSWLRESAPGAVAFWRALAAYEDGDVSEALRDVKGFAAAYPGSAYAPRALRLEAWCQFQLGHTNVALNAFAEFDQAFRGTAEGAQNRLEWGQALIAAGRLAEAELVLADFPASSTDAGILARAGFWRARVMMEQQRWADAERLLADLLNGNIPDLDLRAECAFALGRAREGVANPAGAAEAYAQGLATTQARGLRLSGSQRLGLLYLELGKVDEATGLLRTYVAEAAGDANAEVVQLALADALLLADRFADADAAYQAYLETFTNRPGVARANKGRGWALESMQRGAEAAASFEKAYATFSNAVDRAECLYKAGDAYFGNQQYALAAGAYERLLNEFPDSGLASLATYQLAQSQALGGDGTSAELTYSELVGHFPGTALAAEAMLRVAQLRAARGELAAAAAAYNTLVNAFTNSAFVSDALLGRGEIWYRQRAYERALEDFEAVVARHADGPQAEAARFHMLMCTYLLGQDEEALAEGQNFLTRHPHSQFVPRVQYWLGMQAYNARAYDEAERHFTALYTGHPTDADAENALLWAARSASRAEEYLRANELLTTLIKEFPQGSRIAEARYEQGVVMAALAKFAEAILAFQEVVNRYPNSPLIADTWLRIGDCQFMLAVEDATRYQEAIKAFGAAAAHPNAAVDLRLQAEYKLGRTFQKAGRQDEAVAQYYKNVIVRFLESRDRGDVQSEAARMWFGRAVRDAADLLEERREWRQVVGLLERAVAAGAPDEDGLRERIRDIRERRWWLVN